MQGKDGGARQAAKVEIELRRMRSCQDDSNFSSGPNCSRDEAQNSVGLTNLKHAPPLSLLTPH